MLENTLDSPLDCKEIQRVHPKGDQSWILILRTDTEAEAPILWPLDVKNWHWKRPWCWERLKAGGGGDNRGWHGWMASLIWWTWVWASSGSWWWTGKPDVCSPWGSQRVGHDWTTKLNKSFKVSSPQKVHLYHQVFIGFSYRYSQCPSLIVICIFSPSNCLYICVCATLISINPFVIHVFTKENREAAEWVVLW